MKTGGDDWKTPLGVYERAIAELASTRQELQAELKNLKELESWKANLRSEIQSAKADLQAIKSEQQTFQANLETTKKELSATQIELQNVKAELESKKSEINDIQTKLETTNTLLKTFSTEAQKAVGFAISEAKDAKTQAENALSQIAGLKNQQVVKDTPSKNQTESTNFTSDHNTSSNPTGEVIMMLNGVSGITTAHPRDFEKARQLFVLKDRTSVRMWTNPVGVDHVFLADANGNMVYGGFVGWIHSQNLSRALEDIRRYFT